MTLRTVFVVSFALLVLVLRGADGMISRRCVRTLKSVNAHREVPRTRITMRCDTGRIDWRNPSNRQVVSLFKWRQSFTVCLTASHPGVTVYRLKGASRRLVSEGKAIGCFESECGHVSLLLEADPDGDVPRVLRLTYNAKIDKRCSRCTESCRMDCLCTADYVFLGKLNTTKYSGGHFNHYFKSVDFIKYDGKYSATSIYLPENECNNNNTTDLLKPGTPQFGTSAMVSPSVNTFVPTEGLVKVYSKCALKVNKTYMISARHHLPQKGRGRIALCCADDEERYARSHLEDMLKRQECCRYYPKDIIID